MPTAVTMPALGESVTEGTVTRWLKQEGDHVDTDEPLLEVSTDKVDTEIPSPAAGVLTSIKVAEDETVEVGAELATIGDAEEAAGGGGEAAEGGGGEADTGTPQQAEPEPGAEQEAGAEREPAAEREQEPAPAKAPQPAAEPEQEPAPAAQAGPAPGSQAPTTSPQAPAARQETAAPPRQAAAPPAPRPPAAPAAPRQTAPSGSGASAEPAGGKPASSADAGSAAYVTPLVRKLASDNNVDLGTITGTGVGGRIRKQDVLDAAEQAKQPAQTGPEAVPQPSPATGTRPPAPAPSPLRGQTEKMSRPRKVIAERMLESLQTSAQLTTVLEADVTAIARLRSRAASDFAAREGVKLSFLPFFALASVEALKAHPKLNASIDTEAGEITYYDAEHLSVAVDTERGLMVPVIHDAGDLNLGGLARKIADVAERARTNKIGPDELSGGTFTLTNTGSRGALFDTPIINQPNVGILGTGTVVKRAAVVDDPQLGEVIAVRSMIYLALTYDHRLVDGADAARFLVTVKDRLEQGSFEAELGLA